MGEVEMPTVGMVRTKEEKAQKGEREMEEEANLWVVSAWAR
jgi:hypothetical protein